MSKEVVRYWNIVDRDGNAVVLPGKPFYCPLCGGNLLLHDFRAYYQTTYDFYHVDVHLKCPHCGFFLTFGIPITEEEYKRLVKSKYHGRVLKWELREIYNENEEIKERLEKWGYW